MGGTDQFPAKSQELRISFCESILAGQIIKIPGNSSCSAQKYYCRQVTFFHGHAFPVAE
jgi:hypothetical protein